MGYQVYERNGRDCGYGVPAICEQPGCEERIDRGLGFLCGEIGETGCGRYFCEKHRHFGSKIGTNGDLVEASYCKRCLERKPPYPMKPDTADWVHHKATDPSWAEWRAMQEAERG